MEDSKDSDGSEVEETEVLFLGLDTQALNSVSDIKGEVDLRDELVSALEELEKCRKKNRQSNILISELETQLLDAKKVEDELNLQLKRRIQESKNLAKEIIQFERNLDEGSIKSKFENISRILDDILSSQRASGDRCGLGFIKEKKPDIFPVSNQEGSKKSYAEVLTTPAKKERSKKDGLISEDKNRINLEPKRPNRYLQIFLGDFFSCNNFGHKALNWRTQSKVSEFKKKS